MQVRGRGRIIVRSPSLAENEEPHVEAFINLRNPPVPVVLFLPKNGEAVPEVFGDRDVQITLKGLDNELQEKQFGDVGQKNDKKSKVDSKDKNKYTHQRTNSDYLHVIGKDGPDNVDYSIERRNKDNDDRNVDNKNEIDFMNLEDGFTWPSFKSAIIVNTPGFDTMGSSIATLNKLSEESNQWSDEGTVTESENELEESSFSKLNDSLPLDQKKRKNRQLSFRRSVKSSNTDIWREGKSLKSAIQHSYTYLLDVLDISELCDHMYENSLLDIVMYQYLHKLCSEHQYVRLAKRYLLMYLSTRTICHDKFVDSLAGDDLTFKQRHTVVRVSDVLAFKQRQRFKFAQITGKSDYFYCYKRELEFRPENNVPAEENQNQEGGMMMKVRKTSNIRRNVEEPEPIDVDTTDID
ncbi:hypothetical protein ACF0H5_022460 [Mactra antiquata]